MDPDLTVFKERRWHGEDERDQIAVTGSEEQRGQRRSFCFGGLRRSFDRIDTGPTKKINSLPKKVRRFSSANFHKNRTPFSPSFYFNRILSFPFLFFQNITFGAKISCQINRTEKPFCVINFFLCGKKKERSQEAVKLAKLFDQLLLRISSNI